MNKLTKYFLIISLLIPILITGVVIHKDYGVSSDELNNRLKGIISLNYIGEKILPSYLNKFKKEYSKVKDKNFDIKNLNDSGLIKYYGVTFDLPIIVIELLLDIEETSKKYQLRHLATFLCYFISLIFFYKLIKLRTNDNVLGSFSILILFLTPRIFANSFYNSKDIVFLSFFIIAIYYCSKLLKKQNNKNIFLASLFCALTIDTRIAGIIIPVYLLFIFFIEFLIKKEKLNILNIVKFLILLFTFVIIFWPYLWESPIKNFIEAYKIISQYPLNFNFLFNGSYVNTTSVPFYYHIQWIIITLPFFNLILFLIGLSFFIFNFKKNFKKLDFYFKQDLFIFLILFTVIFLTIFSKITAYDGWRHFYFLYPLILFFSIFAIYEIKFLKIKKITILFFSLLSCSLLYNVIWIIKNHPYQYVYFNFLAGKNLTYKFQMDYWGLSYKQNLLRIFSTELNNNKIKVYNLSANKLFYHALALDDKIRKRLIIVKDIKEAEYVLDNFNYRKKPDKTYLNRKFKIINKIIVDGNVINILYKRL